MLSALPVMTDWLKNRYQVTAEDLILPLLLGLILSIIICVLFYKSFRLNRFAALIGGIFAILILNQKYDERFHSALPILRSLSPFVDLRKMDGLFYSLIFFLIVITLAFLIIRSIGKITLERKWQMDVFANAIYITISVSFLLQFFPLIKTLIAEWPQFYYRPPAISTPMNATADKPDIYYIVLDRYTNQNVLKNQFSYDNSGFINFLTDNNFSVDAGANANFPYTTMSIASTLNAGYNSDLISKFGRSKSQTLEPYHDAVQYASVTQKLKSLGYVYHQLGSWYEADNKAPLADYNYQPEGQLTIFNHTFTLNSFSKVRLQESVLWQVAQHGFRIGNLHIISYNSISEGDATIYKLNQLQKIAEMPAGNRFVFAHILVPHDPYYFKADGSLSTSPNSDSFGEPIKQKYLGQIEFINNQMTDLINKIRKNSDNRAVIIIQSDEGPYPMQLNDNNFDSTAVGDEMDNRDMRDWSDRNLRMKYGVLAAYSIPAAKLADVSAHADSVNIFRLVFNTYFDAKMPYLAGCSYALTNGRNQPFVYADISKRLGNKSESACLPDLINLKK